MNTLAPLDLVSLITVLLAMVILAVISRLYNQSWLEPGSFFLVVWFGFIVLPLIVLQRFQYIRLVSGISFLLLLLSCLVQRSGIK